MSGAKTFALNFRPDGTVSDGRFANNAWLQEIPKPLTKLTWGNAAHLAAADASELSVRDGDMVAIVAGSNRVELPVLVMPGHPQGCITLHLGHRDSAAGRIAAGAVGANVNLLRTSHAYWHAENAQVSRIGRHVPLARTQSHFLMEGEDLVRGGTSAEWTAQPERPGFARSQNHAVTADFYEPWDYTGQAWGMVVDLTACTGCSACIVACQAENNIPTVGRAEVLRHREMHWLRVDVYFQGTPESPAMIRQQPVPCMHCEQAPCEPVCPVAATVHSGSGLNQMVYNRCVGTRYCSNNCPYKVRRFNFLDYSERFHSEELLSLLPNPDVTVRSRGVMEKCTYCVQRIQEATIGAKREQRKLNDGSILTACQQTCPTAAITFGDLNLRNSRVAMRKQSPLNYSLLEELNTQTANDLFGRSQKSKIAAVARRVIQLTIPWRSMSLALIFLLISWSLRVKSLRS